MLSIGGRESESSQRNRLITSAIHDSRKSSVKTRSFGFASASKGLPSSVSSTGTSFVHKEWIPKSEILRAQRHIKRFVSH